MQKEKADPPSKPGSVHPEAFKPTKISEFAGRSAECTYINDTLLLRESLIKTAGPGFGKSFILAHMNSHAEGLSDIFAVKALHVCKDGHKESSDPKEFLKSLENAFRKQVPSFLSVYDKIKLG